MSQYDSIKLILDIKDENIEITGETYKEWKKGQHCFIFPGKLYNKPKRCKNCGFDKLIVHDYVSSDILLVTVSGYKSYLRLAKCRFMCKECSSTVVSKTDIVEANSFISVNVQRQIAVKLQNKQSMTDVAKDVETSPSTVYKILKRFYNTSQPNFNYLPSILSFDEFKSVKGAEDAMSFMIMDGTNNKIINILPSRRLKKLIAYFLKYSRKARLRVRFVSIDMYSPYVQLIRQIFPNAKIITDRFHIVQLIGRSFTSVRVKVMKEFGKQGKEGQKKYRKIKRYWKLLQKKKWLLSSTNYKNYYCFPGLTTQRDIVDTILSYSDELKRHYDLYQEFLWAVDQKDANAFEELLRTPTKGLHDSFKTTIRSYKKFKVSILDALKYPYSNGPIEAMNNHIKVLKRIAYGYRNFYNFKLRIFVVFGNLFPKA